MPPCRIIRARGADDRYLLDNTCMSPCRTIRARGTDDEYLARTSLKRGFNLGRQRNYHGNKRPEPGYVFSHLLAFWDGMINNHKCQPGGTHMPNKGNAE